MSEPAVAASGGFETHQVLNQALPLEDYNVYLGDRALRDAVAREGGAWIDAEAQDLGRQAGAAAAIRNGFLAEEHRPVLHTHDRFGHRIDEVEFHPAYHQLMALGIARQIHGLPWIMPRAGVHVARAALYIVFNQINEGPCCPITMTFASVPALRIQADLAAEWEAKVLSDRYDPANRPVSEKSGATIGMAMTEKQGGSDVRANTSRAQPRRNGGPGGEYGIVGHKWFCSAPMCDAFLVLAQAPGGLSCFLVPRWRPDDTRNAVHFQRLKDKMGNHSNASSEVEFLDAHAVLIGEEGRGVANIIEMVRHTRLDCALGAAAQQRQAVAQAINHCTGRRAFGQALIDQPLMANVLADLAVESEAATALALRVARSFDQAADSEHAAKLCRAITPIAKYWLCKRTPAVATEALECHGGNGFVEQSIMPRLFRDSPLYSVWEGSGNVQCLDLLRAMGRDRGSIDVTMAEIAAARGADRRLDAYAAALAEALADHADLEWRARDLVERLALALQGSLLVRHAPAAVADAFCGSRLDGNSGRTFGTLARSIDHRTILARATPLA